MFIKDHLLHQSGDNKPRVEQYDCCPNVSVESIKPKYIMLHKKRDCADGLMRLYTNTKCVEKESAHLILENDAIHQLAPLTAKTWHAGASSYQGHNGLNNFAIGIVVAGNDMGYWLGQLLSCIVEHYNIRDIINIPRPGDPPFDVTPYKNLVEYGNADSYGRFQVTANNIGVRGGPDVRFEIIDPVPLAAGDGVRVVRYSANKEWAYVIFTHSKGGDKQGWVHESFLRRL